MNMDKSSTYHDHIAPPSASASDAGGKTIVSIKNVGKRFGRIEALSQISIDIRQGEIFALLGPSGCGKSTLLRIISGFEAPTTGELLLDGSDMTQLPPNRRPINMVFQSYAVFPHMSVRDNVAYGLKMDRVNAVEIEERVTKALEQVHLADFGHRKPEQLSGGQRQRVALARALVKQPRVLLLDEPLSALDAKLRDAMRLELVKLQESVGVTFIIVTHDQHEAMAMADRIAVLQGGRIRQIATPSALYQRPVDAFVADFIGNINLFPVNRLSPSEQSLELVADGIGTVQWYQSLEALPDSHQGASPQLSLAVRPEHIRLSTERPDNQHVSITGTLGDIAFQGQHSMAEIIIPGRKSLSAIIDNEQALSLPGADKRLPVWAHWDLSNMLLLPDEHKH